MCKRLCRNIFSDAQSGCFCLALAPTLLICCVLQVAVAVVFHYWLGTAHRSLAAVLTLVSVGDAVTGVWAVCSVNPSLAFCTLLGFFLDSALHLIIVAYGYVAITVKAFSLSDEAYARSRAVVDCVVTIFAAAILWYMMLRVVYSYYRVVQLGGNGWERKSPNDLREEQNSQSTMLFEHLDSLEAQRLLDPDAEYYKF